LTSELLFGKARNIDSNALLQLTLWIPHYKLPKQKLIGAQLTTLVVDAKLQSTKAAAKRLLDAGGIYVNNQRIVNINRAIVESDIIEGKVCVLRTGQSNYVVIIPQ